MISSRMQTHIIFKLKKQQTLLSSFQVSFNVVRNKIDKVLFITYV